MLIQKIFHVRLGLDETKNRLARNYAHVLDDVQVANRADDVTHFEFSTANGFQATVELVALPSDDPMRTLFHSVDGNMQVAGMLEFLPIRDNCTEVQVTVEYAIKSPIHSVIDSVAAALDRFVNKQLRRLEAHFTNRGRDTMRGMNVGGFLPEPQLAHS
jgi:uncharacterized membrane protein